MELIKSVFSLCIVLGILQIIETAPLDNDDLNDLNMLNDEDFEEMKRFAVPWLNENHEVDIRGKNTRNQPEFKEYVDVNSSFASGENSERGLDEELYLQTRGISKPVKEWTVYLPDGTPTKDTIKNLCLQAHNYFRKRHFKGRRTSIPRAVYNDVIARSAEQYSIDLADSGKFEHDNSIGGKWGENLYRMDNTYGLVATPIHAIMAWYEESWKPLKGPPKNYNYKWNPRSAHEFHEAGVGHFTQMIWDESVEIGCGAATTTFNSGGRKWTRTVITTRYSKPGNWLGAFLKHVFPLKKGGTLEGKVKRGKLYPVKTKCVTTIPKSQCEQWKKYKWCDKEFAKRDCYCTCGRD